MLKRYFRLGWWPMTALIGLGAAAASVVVTFLVLAFPSGGSFLAIPLGVFSGTLLLPAALAAAVFVHAGRQARVDAVSDMRGE